MTCSSIAGLFPTRQLAAVNKALQKAGMTKGQMDLIEIQEAFASQALVDARLTGGVTD
ncbi:hypothetical protein ACFLVB_02090 [Chloroflexota bacterium]